MSKTKKTVKKEDLYFILIHESCFILAKNKKEALRKAKEGPMRISVIPVQSGEECDHLITFFNSR